MIENFEKICVTARKSSYMKEDAAQVLKVLRFLKREARPTEIASRLHWLNRRSQINYQRATHSLKFLCNLGLVQKRIIDGEPFEVDTCETTVKIDEGPDSIFVDGIEYIRRYSKYHHESKIITKTIVPKISVYSAVL